MMGANSPVEKMLCYKLASLPREFNYRYSEEAKCYLLKLLFRALAADNDDNLSLLFPNGPPSGFLEPWSLRKAQGAVDGAEYTEAARGHPCGHIFKSGEATYRCKTCTEDDTCVLCARCFEASDHEGHVVYVHVSPGNSGCCDCGDPEAWRRPVYCTIHSSFEELGARATGKRPAMEYQVPQDFAITIRSTVSRALDYVCDVFSCCPEHLRLPKSVETVRDDERKSRLNNKSYDDGDAEMRTEEWALILWNDEKHTVNDVRDQVAKACRQRKSFGTAKALEVDEVGRSVIMYSDDLPSLLHMAEVIEQVKLTVTIRSSRDTFREQMCETIIEWISDLAGCNVGMDPHILRNVICDEMLNPWRKGSQARFREVGMWGIDDHAIEEVMRDELEAYYMQGLLDATAHERIRRRNQERAGPAATAAMDVALLDLGEAPADEGDDEMEIEGTTHADQEDLEMEDEDDREDARPEDDALETSEATIAGYPPPPPPPPAQRQRQQDFTPMGSDDGVSASGDDGPVEPFVHIPVTPKRFVTPSTHAKPPSYWLEQPPGTAKVPGLPPCEDLRQRVRLDYLILNDLRMWKKLRIDMRDLFITTVVTLPAFKRLLGLRFAGLYTRLAELYLIADREPDHSIINLSLQMLTTPSITEEVVERGNFLTVLMAILFSFLTTRQVGQPSGISSLATLAFQDGTVTNRRMYHFFMDLKYLLGSPHVQERLRSEKRYLLQFLDLVKLHQGICPNKRAIGEHIEYETDAWISASMVTREINKLVRQLSDAFVWSTSRDNSNIQRAIRDTAKCVIINALGCERRRFEQAEIESETKFKSVPSWEFELDDSMESGSGHQIVDFSVEQEPMSFHHALHYALSWLIDRGKIMSSSELRTLLSFSGQDLRLPPIPFGIYPIPDHAPEKYLLALFDYPLRVCAWLAQMRAGLWVRNGITLRHQMSTYRGVAQRDVSHQRDIFLLQVALVVCRPATFLTSIVDRFGINGWVNGTFDLRPGYEDHQMIDVAEDFVHLLIILLCERTSLIPSHDGSKPSLLTMKRDITHILCFKPLSFSDFSTKISEKVQESDEFNQLLQDMTRFKPPEGLQDVGTFELKEECLENLDPFIAQYNRNQREEAENLYKNFVAKKTGRQPADVVYEPKPVPIATGLFKDLAGFTQIPLFAQVINNLLRFAVGAKMYLPKLTATRVESFLHFILHLVLLAITEDITTPVLQYQNGSKSFVQMSLSKAWSKTTVYQATTLALLQALLQMPEYKSCEPRVRLILNRLRQKQPGMYEREMAFLNIPVDRTDTPSPTGASLADKELKKKVALERQAKVMAQFKAQQNSFMENQAMDWSDVSDMSDFEAESGVTAVEEKVWKYPTGTCILCQEDTDDSRLFGTFALITESRILRQTPLSSDEWVSEVEHTPDNLDKSADAIRPFGVAGQNRQQVAKPASDGSIFFTERQGLGKGFPHAKCDPGPVSIGCGHIMHFSCFEVYISATSMRHLNQIARNQPERVEFREFLCPLCKALGNAFLPIIWKGKVANQMASRNSQWEEEFVSKAQELQNAAQHHCRPPMQWSTNYIAASLIPSLASLLLKGPDTSTSEPIRSILPTLRAQTLLSPLATAATFISRDEPNPEFTTLSGGSAVVGATNGMIELQQIYRRLRETYRSNGIKTEHNVLQVQIENSSELTHTDSLVNTVAFSIAATEISQRGVECHGLSMLDKLPQQTITHLRILSETVSSYIASGVMSNPHNSETAGQLLSSAETHLKTIFSPFECPSRSTSDCFKPSFLAKDPFVSFVQASYFMDPDIVTVQDSQGNATAQQLVQMQQLLPLYCLAEITRVLLAFTMPPGTHFDDDLTRFSVFVQHQFNESSQQSVKNIRDSSTWSASEMKKMMLLAEKLGLDFEAIAERIGTKDPGQVRSQYQRICQENQSNPAIQNHARQVHIVDQARLEGDLPTPPAERSTKVPFKPIPKPRLVLEKILSSYLSAFLRKALLLFHVRLGIEFTFSHSDESELTRLSRVLQVPTLEELLGSVMRDSAYGEVTRSLVAGWIHRNILSSIPGDSDPLDLNLSHSAIFELVGLPKNYDTLTDEAIRKRCPTTGKELSDPNICLFCGEIFCSQAVCCMKDIPDGKGGKIKIGGCAQHLKKCGGSVGLFIHIRKCMVLFLHSAHNHTSFNGSWAIAPYLDKHGEADPTLRRHHQLYLNQKRYDALLRTVWLQHGIPSVIARRLEADINAGGWETL